MLIQCFEPQGQPRKAAIELGNERPRFAIYATQDLLSEDAKGLRVTVLRHLDEAPPPKGLLVVEMEVRRRRSNEAPGLRVLRAGRKVTLEWLRPDGRSKVTTTTDLRSGARFEALLPDMRTVVFALEVAAETEQGAAASVGGRAPAGAKVAGASAVWIVPAVAALMADPAARAKSMIVQGARKLGISPAVLLPALMTGGLILGAMVVAFMQYNKAQDAEEKMAEMQVDLDQARAGRDAALIAEAACVEERQTIAEALDEITEARKLQAEIALSIPMAQAVAVELGGARMATEEVLEYDAIATKNVKDYVINEMGKKRQEFADPARCRGQKAVLGQDLPEYYLLWNPQLDQLCPEDYVAADGGVDRQGPWGLGRRAADEFGAPMSMAESGATEFGEAPPDPRQNPRWAAAAMAGGSRDLLDVLLGADTLDRPPVSPGQAHLWSLALWDAINRLPKSPEGVMDVPAEDCVKDVLDQVLAQSGPAEPGQPILPDISRLALGDTIPLTPTAECPWPDQTLEKAAKTALEASVRLAVAGMEANDE